jgi:hypothetical protein
MNGTDRDQRPNRRTPSLTHQCLASCRLLLAQIQRAKDAIFAEFRGTLAAHERLLRLALNEAEGLAWQTAYPHLVFPALATEKAQAVVNWNARQQSIHLTALSQAA